MKIKNLKVVGALLLSGTLTLCSGCMDTDKKQYPLIPTETVTTETVNTAIKNPENTLMPDENVETWYGEVQSIGGYELAKVDFEAMLKQKVGFSDEILSNPDMLLILSEIKNYYGDTPLYADILGSYGTNVELYTIDEDKKDISLSLFIVNINQTNYDENMVEQKKPCGIICLVKHDDPLYHVVENEYEYYFDESGNTIYCYLNKSYINEDGTEYSIYSHQPNPHEFIKAKVGDESVYFSLYPDFSVTNYKPCLYIETFDGDCIINLTQEKYLEMSNEMKKYASNNDLLGFVISQKDFIVETLESQLEVLIDDDHGHILDVIKSIEEPPKAKVVTKK